LKKPRNRLEWGGSGGLSLPGPGPHIVLFVSSPIVNLRRLVHAAATRPAPGIRRWLRVETTQAGPISLPGWWAHNFSGQQKNPASFRARGSLFLSSTSRGSPAPGPRPLGLVIEVLRRGTFDKQAGQASVRQSPTVGDCGSHGCYWAGL